MGCCARPGWSSRTGRKSPDGRLRRYYRLTDEGAALLAAETERRRATAAVAAQRLSAPGARQTVNLVACGLAIRVRRALRSLADESWLVPFLGGPAAPPAAPAAPVTAPQPPRCDIVAVRTGTM
jgi:hypothetical protein